MSKFTRKKTVKITNMPILDETYGFIIYNLDKHSNEIEFKRITNENLDIIEQHLTHHLTNYYGRLRSTKINILITQISRSEFYNMRITNVLNGKFPYVNIQLSNNEIVTEHNNYAFSREILMISTTLRKLLNVITYVARMTRREMKKYVDKHNMHIKTLFRTRNYIGKQMLKIMLCECVENANTNSYKSNTSISP